MSSFRRSLIACLVTFVSAPIIGLVAFIVMSFAFRCPPERVQCDLPDMAAFALACVVAPCAGLAVGWLTWRRLARRVTR